jgi:hypothetical protein
MLRRGLNLFEEYLESKIEMNLHKGVKPPLYPKLCENKHFVHGSVLLEDSVGDRI